MASPGGPEPFDLDSSVNQIGNRSWGPEARKDYNIYDPVVRPPCKQSWNVENLRPQSLKNWCLGQELYIRVFDGDPNPAKERPPPHSLLQFYAVFLLMNLRLRPATTKPCSVFRMLGGVS
ncbi:monocopper oxidase protein [Salix suchowensis]|nr:monocopper oxidase protein [Salix suchowensis]